MDSRLSAAGANYYEKAGQDNWESVKRLMINGDTFITDNTAALTANNNMPATFASDFATVKGEFEALYNNFVNTSLDTEVKTQDKIEANNAVYDDLSSMLKDGQRIYKKDEATRKLFTFDQLLNDVAGAGQGGLKGTVTDAVTHQPIEGVLVKIAALNKQVFTDAEGKYSITQLAAGTYTVEFSKAGYQTKTITVTIETGVTNVEDVEMGV